jgi:Domain of unknown function (DUF4382)
MERLKTLGALFLLLPLGILISCGGGPSSTGYGTPATAATVYTLGTDASPTMPNIVSFVATVSGATLSDGSITADLTTTPQTLDFAKLSGLHTLLDLNSVPPGTYTTVNIMLGAATISWLDTSAVATGGAPVVSTATPTLTSSNVSVTLAQPLTLNGGDTVGLFVDFDLAKSISIDGSGNVTVTPTFNIRALGANDVQREIDCFFASVVSVSGSTFIIQGPHGRQYTVSTDSNTFFGPNDGLSTFNTDTIVSVSGTIDPATHDIDADEVLVVSTDNFFADGLNTFVSPTPGPATSLQVFVRSELPEGAGLTLGDISTFGLNGTEIYRIGNINLPITSLLFNNSSLAPGQRVAIGGALDTSTTPPGLTVHRVILQRQRQEGSWVAGSTQVSSGNAGSFQLNDNDLAGVLLPSPLTVMTTNATLFINMNGLSALTGTSAINVRVVGHVLIDPSTSQPVFVARAVEQIND